MKNKIKKIYYYFLYRQYLYYKDTLKEKDSLLLSTSFSATTLIGINLMSAIFMLEYFDIIKVFNSKYSVLVFMFIVWFVNYYFFIKDGKFLQYNFKKDRKGGLLIVLYLVFTVISTVYVVNINRENRRRIRSKLPKIEHKQRKPSLEEDIRKWFKENF